MPSPSCAATPCALYVSGLRLEAWGVVAQEGEGVRLLMHALHQQWVAPLPLPYCLLPHPHLHLHHK